MKRRGVCVYISGEGLLLAGGNIRITVIRPGARLNALSAAAPAAKSARTFSSMLHAVLFFFALAIVIIRRSYTYVYMCVCVCIDGEKAIPFKNVARLQTRRRGLKRGRGEREREKLRERLGRRLPPRLYVHTYTLYTCVDMYVRVQLPVFVICTYIYVHELGMAPFFAARSRAITRLPRGSEYIYIYIPLSLSLSVLLSSCFFSGVETLAPFLFFLLVPLYHYYTLSPRGVCLYI